MASRLTFSTVVAAPMERCFDLSCDIDVHLGSMKSSGEEAIAGITSGLIGPGEEVTWRARHFGLVWTMTSRITDFDRPNRFVDEMQRGPFEAFRHEHTFSSDGELTTMADTIDYALPLGPLGSIVNALIVGRHLSELISTRNLAIKELAETPSS